MELPLHFSHDHPLIEHVDDDGDGVPVSCFGCLQPISGQSYYGCSPCMFFLHKSCAELPPQMTHHSHPFHPLTLLRNPHSLTHRCDVCRDKCYRFIYRCFPCDFNFCNKCALVVHNIQQRIDHTGHTHHLIPLHKPAKFSCDACGAKHEGTSYLCTTCGFWVNQECANSFPTTIKLTNHHHPLTLIYSIPHQNCQPRPNCTICKEPVYRRNWVYYCSDSECRYFVHVNCATSDTEYCKLETQLQDLDLNPTEGNSVASGTSTSNTELSKDCKIEIKVEDLGPALITLPGSTDQITQFMKHLSRKAKYKEETYINHVSHDHPLIFCDKKIDDMPLSNEVKVDDEKCNGCALSISTPFYHCAQCNFFLHKWCAELPNELQHPCHPEHQLLLTTNFYPYKCQCCGLYCNIFSFGCFGCKFFLDIKCASLPRIIKHEAHKHTLALRQASSNRCSTCKGSIFRWAFVCDSCNINICIRCALLPNTVRHRYDEHPFTLTYSPPLKGQAVDDNYESYCEICEGEINLKLWFYHCNNCDQSLDTKCICPPVDEYSNIKYGVTLNIGDHHPHLLTSVRSRKGRSRCSHCLENIVKFYRLVYKCEPCNYRICYSCVTELVHK